MIAACMFHLGTLAAPEEADVSKLVDSYADKLTIPKGEVREQLSRLLRAEAEAMRGGLAGAVVKRGAPHGGVFVAESERGVEPVAEEELGEFRVQARARYRVFIDRSVERLFVDGAEVELDATPMRCLEHLLLQRNKACSFGELWRVCSERSADPAATTSRGAVRQWVSQILKATGWERRALIRSIRRLGYQWVGKLTFCVLRREEQPNV